MLQVANPRSLARFLAISIFFATGAAHAFQAPSISISANPPVVLAGEPMKITVIVADPAAQGWEACVEYLPLKPGGGGSIVGRGAGSKTSSYTWNTTPSDRGVTGLGVFMFMGSPPSGASIGGPSIQIMVLNNTPIFTSIGINPNPAQVGDSVNVAYSVTDADSDRITCTIDWGDGSLPTVSATGGSHAYQAPGGFTIKVTANDGHGGIATAGDGVTIIGNMPPPMFWGEAPPGASEPPTLTSKAMATPGKARAGQPIVFVVGASDAESKTLSYTWDFGDGSTGNGCVVTHTYAARGKYTATARISNGTSAIVSVVAITVRSARR